MKKLLLWCLVMALLLSAAALAETVDYTFDASSRVLTGYSGEGGDVVVPAEVDGKPVFGVDRQLFARNEGITSVTIPEPIAVLDDAALTSMPALTTVTLPDTLQFIGSSNFMDCAALTEVVVPPRVLQIEADCFKWAGSLKSVTFTGPAPQMGDGCFRSVADGFTCYVPDDRLDEYRAALPEGLNIQPSGANAIVEETVTPEDDFDFDVETGTVTRYNGSAPRVVIPAEIGGAAVKAVGDNAFQYDETLFSVSIPDGVERVGEGAFHGAKWLCVVDLPDSVAEFGEYAFYNGYLGERFPWPAGLRVIGEKAFNSTQLGNEVRLPEGLETIGEYAFSNARFKQLVLPASLLEIGAHAFDSVRLDTIEFGNTTASIGEKAFSWMYPTQVTVPANTDDATLAAYTELFTGLKADCQVVRAEGEAPALTEADLERYGGLWYLNTVEQDGVTLSAADLGMDFTLLLNDDGTAVMTSDEEENGSWRVEGEGIVIALPDTDDVALTEADGLLTAAQDDIAMTFGRAPAEPGYTPGDTIEADAVDAFDGTWRCTRAEVYGMSMPIEMFADSMQDFFGMDSLDMEIRGGDVRMISDAIERFSFADGALFTDSDPARTLTLLDDGMIACAISGGTLYFEKTSDETTLPEPEPDPQPEPEPEPAGISDADFALYGGKWILTELRMGGSVMNAADIGANSSFTLNADGTVDAETDGEIASGVWKMDGDGIIITDDSGMEARFAIEDGKLIGESQGTGMVLERESAEPEPEPEPQPEPAGISDADFALYGGEWELTELNLNGQSLVPADMGMTMHLTLNADGTAQMSSSTGDETGSWTVAADRVSVTLGTSGTVGMRMADGCLRIEQGVQAMIFSRPGAQDDSGLAAFNGDWEAVSVDFYGVSMPLNADTAAQLAPMTGMKDTLLRIEDGSVTWFGNGPETFEYADGRLTSAFVSPDGTPAEALDKVAELNDDGSLTFHMMGMTFTCRRAEAPAPEPTSEPTAAPEPIATPEPTATPAPNPITEARFTCTRAEVGGYNLDPSMLGGEYAVVFHQDHSVSFTVSGARLNNLSWRLDGDVVVIDYYDAGELRFVPADGGYTLDYFGTMTMYFTQE